ncbi:hypothetical protein MYX75_02365 [Acidobacteria bacterium AH-259-A15]|nr:hypothetical protein [Acidobacteria bacterium AH-259-A15]
MVVWNSLESVSRLHYWIMVSAVSLGFLAALLYLASLFTQHRVNHLRGLRDETQQNRIQIAEEASEKIKKELDETREKQVTTEKELESVRQENQKLTEKHTARSLNHTATSELVSFLKDYHYDLTVERIFGDPESNRYAEQVISALQESGWELTINASGARLPPVYGLIIELRTPDNPPQAARVLMSGLEKAGLDFSIQQGPSVVGLIIGHKPPDWEWD